MHFFSTLLLVLSSIQCPCLEARENFPSLGFSRSNSLPPFLNLNSLPIFVCIIVANTANPFYRSWAHTCLAARIRKLGGLSSSAPKSNHLIHFSCFDSRNSHRLSKSIFQWGLTEQVVQEDLRLIRTRLQTHGGARNIAFKG